MSSRPTLPGGIILLERGWLSSNNILVCGRDSCALVDSGYVSHAKQTISLVETVLAGRQLNLLVNTHLHSDHCGGNAALQDHYPELTTLIPPGLSEHVRSWDPQALTYTPTGQSCPQFQFNSVMEPGTEIKLGDLSWQIHAAPGHDPHSVILFEPSSRVLLSADALWESGFGVVFPELEGSDAFDEVGQTIDLIESLSPKIVIPGHGPAFSNIKTAITAARRRLDGFVADPARHVKYASKVLLKFKLLEAQAIELPLFTAWALSSPYFRLLHAQHVFNIDFPQWIDQLTLELVKSGAASRDGLTVRNT
ncbi:MAG: MBL fold metallo-hydrolase [Rhodoferax sp.]|uniref:MBL fold metallo-hydrolase n=1 Tax=Rhodoferax sp. TaxID=50421 RepID=UPI002625A3C8|nr:MBL fold metallo-hydrolase [Rhodoferax sp.]MDD5333707.1 MBL fold metallo-hydrolase [Rhodoferax sp.]